MLPSEPTAMNPEFALGPSLLAVAEALSHDIKSAVGTIGLKLLLAQHSVESDAKKRMLVSSDAKLLENWRERIKMIYDDAEKLKTEVRFGYLRDPKDLSQQMLERMINPIEALQKQINRLVRRLKSDKETHQALREARTAVTRVSHILTSLQTELDDEKEYDLRLTNLRSFAYNAIEQLFQNISANRARIEIDGTASVLADQASILSLYGNIIENSIKYRRPNVDPIVFISISKENLIDLKGRLGELLRDRNAPNEWASIVISDNGIGIEDDEKTNVFNFGYRVDADIEIPGSGYGLSRVKSIIRRHRGKYDLRDSEDGGVEIEIILPIDPRQI